MPLMTTLGLVSGGLGALQGLVGGSKMASDARKGIQNFQYQDLSIGAFDRMKASMEAENRALEKSAEMRFGAVDVAQGLSGSEAMNFLSAMEERIGEKEKDVFESLIKEESRIDQLQAQDFITRRNMQEQRDVQDLQSLQQQLYAGKQMQADSLKGLGELAVGAGIGKMQALATDGTNPFAKQNAAKKAQRIANRAAGKGFLGKNTGLVQGLGGVGKFLFGQGGGKGGGLFGKGIKGLGGLLGKGLKFLGL